MTFLQRQYRKRLSLALALGILCGYYILVYRPLVIRERAQVEPFESTQEQLLEAAKINPAVSGLSLSALSQLEATLQESLVQSAQARAFIETRFAPEPAIATNLNRAWQLIDYQNERQRRVFDLLEKARGKGVGIDPAVTAGLPEVKGDTERKELLWAQLGMVDSILNAAVDMSVTKLEDLFVPSPIIYPAIRNGEMQLVEIPIRVQFSGNWSEITRTLGTLLLGEGDRAKLGLPERVDSPGMSLRNIIARKAPPDGPSTIQLEVELSGFLTVPARAQTKPVIPGNQ